MAWTPPRTWAPTYIVTAADLNEQLRDNTLALKAMHATMFSGLALRTHPDNDKAANQVMLTALDQAVMSDGYRYSGLTLPLTADITINGAGGLDTSSRDPASWYEVHLIGKSSTLAVSDLRLLLHHAKDYKIIYAANLVDNSSEKLRQGATDRINLAQGINLAVTTLLPFVNIKLMRVGSPVGNVWLTIESDTAGNPSGSVLATSDKLNAATIQLTPGQVLCFPFRTPMTIAASTQYHIRLWGDYTVSGTNYVQWQGDSGGAYPGGSAKKFDGTTWTAVTPLDYYFEVPRQLFGVALTMPTGYDQSCQLGWVQNNGVSSLSPSLTINRRYTPLSDTAIVVNPSTATPAFVRVMPATDFSPILPPVPVMVTLDARDTGAAAATFVGGVPDGYLYSSGNTTTSSRASGQAAMTLATSAFLTVGPVATDFGALYLVTTGGATTFYLNSFEW